MRRGRGHCHALLRLHRDREGDGAWTREVGRIVDDRVERQRDAIREETHIVFAGRLRCGKEAVECSPMWMGLEESTDKRDCYYRRVVSEGIAEQLWVSGYRWLRCHPTGSRREHPDIFPLCSLE